MSAFVGYSVAMSKQSNSGEKTENATPKRRRDARKQGDVAKSRDLTNTLGLAFATALIWSAAALILQHLMGLFDDAVQVLSLPFADALEALGMTAVRTFLGISALILLPIAGFGILTEFLQTGPLFSLHKVLPKLENLDPAAGVQRMFSLDNFIEVIKNLAKTAVLFIIPTLVIYHAMSELVHLPANGAHAVLMAMQELATTVFSWTLGLFALLMLLDLAYQQYAYNKKLRMSLRDIRQEHKDSEGDPMIKNQRREMHKSFSNTGSDSAARSATVLLVNPTHLAIAINYDAQYQPVPMVAAKAEDEQAIDMRQAAAESQVPVLRNELLARTLFARVDEGDPIPSELFDVVAEVNIMGSKNHLPVEWRIRTINNVWCS